MFGIWEFTKYAAPNIDAQRVGFPYNKDLQNRLLEDPEKTRIIIPNLLV